MRFISVFTYEAPGRLPTEAEMASMGKFIAEGMQAGCLIECEGVTSGTTGVRVHKAASGKITVTDGPFAETKEALGGYALLSAASKEEVVEHTRLFVDHVDKGTWETYQLYEMPTGELDLAARSWEKAVREAQQHWDEDCPDRSAEEHEFAAAWRNQPKWAVSRTLKSVGPNATLVEDDVEAVIRGLKAQRVGEIEVARPDLAGSLTNLGLKRLSVIDPSSQPGLPASNASQEKF